MPPLSGFWAAELFYFKNFHLFGVGCACADEGGPCDMGDVADFGDGGYADAWVEAHFFEPGEGEGIEGDGIGGGEEKAWGGGVVGVKIFATRKFKNKAIGDVENGLGFEQRIAGEDFTDGGVWGGDGFEEATRVIDAADGEGGAATVDTEVGITGHGAEIDDFGFFGGDEFSEVGPEGNFVAAGGAA